MWNYENKSYIDVSKWEQNSSYAYDSPQIQF